MKLVLAEKPSVAQSIAKVIGATNRNDGYLEGNGYVVSWCVGHLVELAEPESYDEKYKKWNYEDLPIMPTNWNYQVSSATKKQFGILKKLMKRSDITSLVCATDAGREGELIFRLVYQECNCKKPFERLWISSMEDSVIKKGFENLKPSKAYDLLYEAALCRERADWLVGINATRLFSCLYNQPFSVGRVMTPTLAMTVMREAAISVFKQEPFYTVEVDCGFIASSERFKEKEKADEAKNLCESVGKVKVVAIEKKEKNEKAPALYDLTSLQRDSNRLLGYTAKQTLDYAQSLYEKKLITYPRTDSRYLTEDMKDGVGELLNVSKILLDLLLGQYDVSQIINNKKVSDHHAIIPTKEVSNFNLEELPSGELAVLKMIALRLLVSVSKVHKFEETNVELACGDLLLKAKGKVILNDGWKIFSPKDKKEQSDLPSLKENEDLDIRSVKVKEGKTSPPKHFTEDTLLSAMENASAEELPKEAERKGIGTPATRAGIIEKLVQKGYVKRVGDKKTKNLIPTDVGVALITVMPEQIQSPTMTAEWEEKLIGIEKGEMEGEAFMEDIQTMVRDLVGTYEVVKGADVIMLNKNHVVGRCPHCDSEVIERQKGWFCENKQCRFVLWKDNAFFTYIGKKINPHIVDQLLRDGKARLKDCKSKKTGKSYNADVLLSTEADGRAKFSLSFEQKGKR